MCGKCQVDSICIGVEDGKGFLVDLLVGKKDICVDVETFGPAPRVVVKGDSFTDNGTEEFGVNLSAELNRELEQ